MLLLLQQILDTPVLPGRKPHLLSSGLSCTHRNVHTQAVTDNDGVYNVAPSCNHKKMNLFVAKGLQTLTASEEF